MNCILFGLDLRNETEEKLIKKKREKANRKAEYISKPLSQAY